MTHVKADWIWDTTTSTGTGSLTLAGAPPTGYRAFSAVMANNDTCLALFTGRSTGTRELSLCTWATGNVLTRNTWIAGTTGSTVDWTNETKDVQIVASAEYTATGDASQFWASVVSLASAATVNIAAAASNYINITGTTTITAFDSPVIAGAHYRLLKFAGALTLTHNGTSLILPSGANIITVAGDVAMMINEGGSNWRCLFYSRASGASLGATQSAPPSITRTTRTSNTILGLSDVGKLIDITSGTFSQTFTAAATLTALWSVFIRNSGTGDITLDPNASETIDGLTTLIMYPGEMRLIECDGSNFTSQVIAPFRRTFTGSGSLVVPPGYSSLGLDLVGGGGGGGSGRRGATSSDRAGGGAGGGGARHQLEIDSLPAAGTSITVTIGAAGTAGSAQGTNSTDGNVGGVGGTTSFGSHAFAYGGGPGAGGTTADASGGGGGGTLSAGAAATAGGKPAISGNSFGTDAAGGGGGGSVSGGGSAEWGGASGGTVQGAAPGAGFGSIYGGPGGGSGGCVDSGNTASAGGMGGVPGQYEQAASGGAAGGASGGANAGTVGAAGVRNQSKSGGGGGGGGGSNTTAGGTGGTGGTPGGGGGGGGASVNGSASGAGGPGGPGQCVVWGIV